MLHSQFFWCRFRSQLSAKTSSKSRAWLSSASPQRKFYFNIFSGLSNQPRHHQSPLFAILSFPSWKNFISIFFFYFWRSLCYVQSTQETVCRSKPLTFYKSLRPSSIRYILFIYSFLYFFTFFLYFLSLKFLRYVLKPYNALEANSTTSLLSSSV